MTKASIVVPSYRGASRLPRLFASFEQQTLSDIEMVVVLDGDVDGSRVVADVAAARLPLRVVELPENRGRPAALNAGFRAATGEILIRADDDLELEADFARRHVELHEEGPRGVIGMCLDVFPDTAYAKAYGEQADLRIRQLAYDMPASLTWRWWCGNVSTPRALYDEVGEYDESFRAYGWEDIDWGYRLHERGYPIVVSPDFETLHHGPVTSTRERAERAYQSGAARRRFERKHGGEVLQVAQDDKSLWSRLVALTAMGTTQRTVSLAGRSLDRVIGTLPRPVAQKAVALLVEAGARAGYQKSA